MTRLNWGKVVANTITLAMMVMIAIFVPITYKYSVELAQALLILTIALLAFCGVFIAQIKFHSKPSYIDKIPNIGRIVRGLQETVVIAFSTLFLLLVYFIHGDDKLLTFNALFVLYQYGYFLGGANSAGLFRR